MKGWRRAVCVGLCLLTLYTPNAGAGAVKKPLTLQQALEIGMKRAVDWNPKAKLATAMSGDFPMERESGEEGRRRLWHEEFGVPGTTDHLRLTVEDGEIKAVRETKGEDRYLDNRNAIDSPEAWKRAKTEAQLRPSEGVSFGYHYRLEIGEANQARLAVLGSDSKGRPLQVHVFLRDKRSLTVYRKDITGGGLYVGDRPLLGAEGEKHWSIYGVELAPDEKATMVAWGYPDPAEQLKPFAKLSQDRGEHWHDIRLPGIVRRFWWQGSHQLYGVGTRELWRSNDEGQTWSTVWQGTRKNQLQSADSYQSQIVLLTDEGVQFSKDEGRTWHPLDVQGTARQAVFDADGTLYVEATGIARLRGGTWEKVPGRFLQKNGGQVVTAKETEFYLPTPDGIKTFLNPENRSYVERVSYTRNRLYALSHNQLYTRSLEEDAVWTKQQMPDDGLLTDFAVGPQQELYLAFGPKLVWKKQ
ncbi:hypothetical protein JJB07_11375 [Tumebacillus sp. ITR2]|uniref:Exo-alpha-sialidase n=1 Tax=Tumebacillus amylolyticus TaxID=2801339 RepID=A0ABS1JAI4_9BACL|nr:hypothetical protein [Tumebacillus amylolyticus]MBL0387251.1 hypothetical protein [Tumebacillus amylolyticus]